MSEPEITNEPFCGRLRWLWGLAVALGLSGPAFAQAESKNETPFLRLRETTGGYHGVSEDYTDLTEIRIGWFAPAKADDPVNGDLWWSASLAAEEANASRPASATSGQPLFASLPIRLVPCWTEDPWGSGVSQLTRMVYNDQPLALLGSLDSATTHLAEQVVAKANLPLISPVATDKTTTLAGVSWMFSCSPDDTAAARVLVDALLGADDSRTTTLSGFVAGPAQAAVVPQTSAPRLVLLSTTDHESRMTTREIVRELSRRGHAPDFRFELAPGLVDFEKPLRAAIDAQPTKVLVVTGASDAARITRDLRSALGAVPIYGSQCLGRHDFLELAGAAAEGVHFPVMTALENDTVEANRFKTRFHTEHHREPDYTAFLTYDATRLLIEAIQRAGPNRARIRETVTQLSPWKGTAGVIDFDGTGRNRRSSLSLGTYRNGVLVRTSSNEALPLSPTSPSS